MLLKFSVIDNITHKKSQYYTSGSISLKIKIIVRLKKNGSKSSSNSLMRFVPVALKRRLKSTQYKKLSPNALRFKY